MAQRASLRRDREVYSAEIWSHPGPPELQKREARARVRPVQERYGSRSRQSGRSNVLI